MKAFQRLSRQGCIKTYDEFLIWCEENYVPELGSMPQHQFDEDEIEDDNNHPPSTPSPEQEQQSLQQQQPSTTNTTTTTTASSSSH